MSRAIQLTTRPDAVAVLTFDQPESQANVLTPELWAEFESVLDSLAARKDLRGLVLNSAKPGVFIAGADLKLLADARGPNDPAVREFIEQGLRTLDKLESLPFGTCAAINGAALGGGLEVALACDHRVGGASPKLALGLPEVTLGLIPGWGGTQRLPRIIGLDSSDEILSTGRNLDGREALVFGLLRGMVDTNALTDTAARLCLSGNHAEQRERKRRPLPPSEQEDYQGTLPIGFLADRVVVRVMTDGAARPLKDGIAVETEAFLRLAGSEESKKLIAAFFASRKK